MSTSEWLCGSAWLIAIMTTVPPMTCAGCSRDEREELARNTKRRILSSDSVLVIDYPEGIPVKGLKPVKFRVAAQAFREQLANAIEVREVLRLNLGKVSTAQLTREVSTTQLTVLEFYESGTRTLRLHLFGSSGDLDEDGETFTVFVEDFIDSKETMAEFTASLSRVVKAKVLQVASTTPAKQ